MARCRLTIDSNSSGNRAAPSDTYYLTHLFGPEDAY